MIGFAGTASGQERRIRRVDLPAAVERIVQAQSQGATVRGFTVETEKGVAFYEVEMIVAGHSKDVLMDATGAVVEVEEQVALDALPAAVRDGLLAKAGSGKIAKVESLTKASGLVAYEAQLVTAGRRSEIQVGPDGKQLDHEE
jgi:uncharacterized membrane protein YkoI